MNLRLTAISVASIVALYGCAGPTSNTALVNDTQSAVNDTTKVVANSSIRVTDGLAGTQKFALEAAEAAKSAKVAKRSAGSWVGARTVSVQSDSVLPAVFYETWDFNFDDVSRPSLNIVAERMTRLTGVTVRISADVFNATPTSAAATGAGNQAAAQVLAAIKQAQAAALPAGSPGQILPSGTVQGEVSPKGEPGVANYVQSYVQPLTSLTAVEMRWNGTMVSYLDYITARLNLSWSYRDGVVLIERYVTESFELAAFGGSQNYKMSLTGAAAAGNGGATMDVTEDGSIEFLNAIKAAVDQLVKPTNGSTVMNLATGRITVTATKDAMSRVRDMVRIEGASLTRQAQIQFDVYSVTSNRSDEQGVDWSVIFSRLSEAWGATLTAPTSLASSAAGSLGVKVLTGVTGNTSSIEFGGSGAVLKLLNEHGSNAKVRPITMIALNRQWARKTNLANNTYVSETTTSSTSSGTTGGQKTAVVTTGDKVLVQPAILDDGKIMLKFGLSLTELLSLLSVTSGSGASSSTVQTPNTAGVDDQATVSLLPGQAMVVTGLSRRTADSKLRTLGESVGVGAGGSQSQSFKREEFMLVVRVAQI